MSGQLPSIRRLRPEDFPDQSDWIDMLLQPLNQFMDTIWRNIDKNLTLAQNLQAEIRTVQVDSTSPALKLRNTLNLKPTAVLVGNTTRVDGTPFTLTTSVQVQWSLDTDGSIIIDNVVGVTPSSTEEYYLTLLVFTA
jgi:hypothetical protein